jgi:predicted heme/steroid binding protein/uncharacterized membrane protein
LVAKDKKFSAAELAEFNGTAGKPVYLAFQGKIIDVSDSPFWKGGHHMAAHQAGHDLTGEIASAPHGPEVLEKFPQVGVLRAADEAERRIPGFLAALLKRFPLLKRHPHPMVVHFPIVFMISTTAFNILYLLTGNRSFELTALHCLAGGILFTPVAIGTGLFTWWLNYEARFLKPLVMKLTLSPILFVVALTVFVWRLLNPDILASFQGTALVYGGLVAALSPLVAAIGWYGASLSFPVEKE